MTVAHRQRLMTEPRLLSAGTPYVEQADRRENRLDSALLHAWGRASPYLLSRLWRKRLDRLVQRAEDQEKRVTVEPDERVRQTADALRGRLSSATCNLEDTGLAFALAREAARRHTGMRHFHVQLLGGAAMMAGALAVSSSSRCSRKPSLDRAQCCKKAKMPSLPLTVRNAHDRARWSRQ